MEQEIMSTEQLRALDAFLAEKVMGWKRATIATMEKYVLVPPGVPIGGNSVFIPVPEGMPPHENVMGTHYKPFCPTTDWADMGQLIERARELHIDIRIHSTDAWVAWTARGGFIEDAEAATMPLAVSQAIALAFGWKGEA